jgi:hypothetical protein
VTAQMSDRFIFRGEDFYLSGINGVGLFNPRKYKMKPTDWCTACHTGFLSTYEIKDKLLFLKELEICLTEVDCPGQLVKKVKPKEINGKLPSEIIDDRPFEYFYEDLYLKVPFNGGLVIANNFIDELYVHMGFHPPWKYKTVYELIFQNGNLLEERDLSQKMEVIRKKRAGEPLRPAPPYSPEVLMRWISDCFSQKYDFD